MCQRLLPAVEAGVNAIMWVVSIQSRQIIVSLVLIFVFVVYK